MKKYLCLSIDCGNKVERHHYNFDTGFCNDCQKEYEKSVAEMLGLTP